MRKNSVSVSVSAAFEDCTAIGQLRAITGADKVARHDAVEAIVGTICALALANKPAPGVGNPADHGKVAKVFAEAKMQRYADACVGLSVALKVKGMRSIESWEDALIEGFAMASSMLADLRPKTYTKAELAKREATKAAKAAEREKAAKLEEANAAATVQAQLEQAYNKGKSEATPIVSAQMVADMIRSGGFDADGINLIAAALDTVFPRIDTPVAVAV